MIWLQRLLLPLFLPLCASQALPASADFTHCTVCHGSRAQGNASVLAPALAGIEPWYLAEALAAYRAGQRGQAASADLPALEMRIAARDIPAEQDSSILQFLDQLGRQPMRSSVAGDARSGRRLYSQHCASCHGANARGNALLHAPDLARLNDWYIVTAFRKYQSGLRGADPITTWANQMHMSARALPADFPIHDIARFIGTLTGATRRD